MRWRAPLLSNIVSRRLLSTSRHVDLAYTRHDPPSASSSSHPPILLMHGLFGSQRNNRTMSKILARDLKRPVYTLDLRNHGDSQHDATHTYTAMAEDVESFIHNDSDLASSSPILVGHSMGAKVAMTLALRQPTKYSGIVPVDNAPLDAALKSDFGVYVNAMKEIEDTRPRITKQSDADKVLEKYEKNVSIRQFLLTNFVKVEVDDDKAGTGSKQKEMRFRIPLTTLARALPEMADFPFKDPDSVRYEGPTLMVRGTKSHYVSDESLPLLGKFFPKFELLDCDCGHWVIAEKPEEFRQGVVEWVRRRVDGDDERE